MLKQRGTPPPPLQDNHPSHLPSYHRTMYGKASCVIHAARNLRYATSVGWTPWVVRPKKPMKRGRGRKVTMIPKSWVIMLVRSFDVVGACGVPTRSAWL